MVLSEEFAKNASINKKVIGKMKDELAKGHMSECVAIAPKVYAYQQIQIDKSLSEDKKARGTKKWLQKRHFALIIKKSVYSIMKRLNA